MTASLPSAPRNPSGHAPLRRPSSLRRTSSIDITWPEGRGHRMRFDGRGRDIRTGPAGGDPVVLAEDRVLATLAVDRTIEAIESFPPRPDVARLVGARGGGYLRQALDETLPAERDAGSPLYLLIDDISGASLIANWAWSRWTPDWLSSLQASSSGQDIRAIRVARMENICTGFRSGSSALDDVRGDHNYAPVVLLPNPEDPKGWHEMPNATEASMRRARRIDIWRDGLIHVDAMFQDSANLPEGGRMAIHEYTLEATIDPADMTLLSLRAEPRILPYRECPAAIENLPRLIGLPVRQMRSQVLERLPRALGCTHLNDALRALAEVPTLLPCLD